VTAGIPAELQGEGATNVRTGKRGDSIMSATIDFPIKEAQDMLATSMQTENCIAIATMKSYFGNDRKQFFVTWKNAKGPVDYIANEVFENDNQMVSFSHAGSDANSLIVGLGQRLGPGVDLQPDGGEAGPADRRCGLRARPGAEREDGDRATHLHPAGRDDRQPGGRRPSLHLPSR